MKRKLFSMIIALLCLCVMFTFVACDSDDETTTTTADNGNTPADPSDGTGDNTGSGGEDDPSIGGNTGSTVHRHTYATEWSTTETHHWHAATCEHTDEKKDYAEHAWGEGEVIRPATCTLEGVKLYTCVCGEIKDEDIPLIDHTYSTEWSYDATGHWHDYSCGCAEGINDSFEGHQLETEIIKAATEVSKGLEKHTCKTCGYSYTTDTPWYIPGSDIPATIFHGYYGDGSGEGFCFDGNKVHIVKDYEVINTHGWTLTDGWVQIDGDFLIDGYIYKYCPAKKTNEYLAFYDWVGEDESLVEIGRLPYQDVDIIYKDYTGLILNGYFEGEVQGNTLGFFFKNNQVYGIVNRETVLAHITYQITKQTIYMSSGSGMVPDRGAFSVGDGYIKIEGIKFYPADLSGGIFDDDYDPDDPEHEHVYADLWFYNDTHHWHNAICAHWDETKDLGEHEWDDGEVTRAATCLEAGELTYTCFCGATYTEEIPMLTEQNWDEGTVTVPPTCSGTGTMLYTCECGATREEIIPMLDHTYATEWSRDESYHWHAATCGHSDLKKDHYSHSWGNGVVTTPATCGAPGVRTYTCECGASTTQEIPQLAHTYATDWTWDDTHHWHAATCEHSELVKGYAEHTWIAKYFYEDSNECGSRVTHIYGCDCGASKSETESNEVHSYSDEWNLNETHHWREATCEHHNEKADYSEHTWDDVNTEVISSSCGDVTITTYTCVCGKSKTEETSNEVHSFSNKWTQSETHHWYAATCEHSDVKDGYERHQYGSDHTCTVCSFFFDGSYTAGLEYSLDYNTGNSYIVEGIGTATDTDIIIPATYQGLPVTKIDINAFYGCAHLTSIYIPDSVVSVGDDVFDGCTGLIQVENGVSYVGKWVIDFDSYGSVTDVVLRADTVGIADGAFSYSRNLTSIEIPAGLKHIGYGAFINCSNLTQFTIPGSVVSLDSSVFRDCTALASVTIEQGVTKIGGEAFSGCTALTSIDIPDSVISIDRSSFYGCTGLIQVVNGVSYVDKWVIGCDETVTNVVLRADTIGIADRAFRRCETLTSIELPAGLKSIGSYAFENCSALEAINITDNVVYLGEYGTFRGCTSLTSIYIPNSITTIGNSMFEYSGLTSIIIPDNVKSIGGSAFYGCEKLESVTIGDGVTSIGAYAFRACPNLTSVIIGSGVESVGSVAFGECPKLESVIIKDGVKVIPDSMFFGCNALTSIEIPNSVTSIGTYAFSWCTSLTSLVIPKSVTSIGDHAFNFGGEAANIYYLGNEEEWNAIARGIIGDEIIIYFYSEEEPTKFGYYWHYVEGVITIREYRDPYEKYFIFTDYYGSYSIKPKDINDLPSDLVIPAYYMGKPVTKIEDAAFQGCTSLVSIVIPDTVTIIGYSAFQDCTSLTSLHLPASFVSTMYSSIVENCPALESITVDPANTVYKSIDNCLILISEKKLVAGCKNSIIPTDGSVTSIGAYAFGGCTGLTSIVIPDCITTLNGAAFNGCTGLTSISIGSGVTSIASTTFDGCSGITSITVDPANTTYQSIGNCLIERATKTLMFGCKNSTIPTDGSVTVIGSRAFYRCTGLTEITIPDCITSIGSLAFYGSGLQSITIGKGVASVERAAFAECASLTSISVDAANSVYHAKGNCLIETETGTLVFGANNCTIPNDGSVTSIGSYAFYMFQASSITIPNTVTTIGDYAFQFAKITSIILPDSVTGIGMATFTGCEQLTSITIGKGLSSIGGGAFLNCTALTSFIIDAENPYYSFDGNCLIQKDNKTLVLKPLNGIIPDDGSVEIIGTYAFYNSLDLTDIKIPDGITSIDAYAFFYCSNLTSITIPKSVTSIGDYAFYFCSGIQTVYYTGTAEEWSAITMGSSNYHLTRGTVYYYSETEPTDSGNYWHYVEGVPTAW